MNTMQLKYNEKFKDYMLNAGIIKAGLDITKEPNNYFKIRDSFEKVVELAASTAYMAGHIAEVPIITPENCIRIYNMLLQYVA